MTGMSVVAQIVPVCGSSITMRPLSFMTNLAVPSQCQKTRLFSARSPGAQCVIAFSLALHDRRVPNSVRRAHRPARCGWAFWGELAWSKDGFCLVSGLDCRASLAMTGYGLADVSDASGAGDKSSLVLSCKKERLASPVLPWLVVLGCGCVGSPCSARDDVGWGAGRSRAARIWWILGAWRAALSSKISLRS